MTDERLAEICQIKLVEYKDTTALLVELKHALKAEREENQRLKEKLDWLDNNTTHYLTNESEAPVLAGVAEKIWYHATDNVDSYPFSAVIDKALEKQHE